MSTVSAANCSAVTCAVGFSYNAAVSTVKTANYSAATCAVGFSSNAAVSTASAANCSAVICAVGYITSRYLSAIFQAIIRSSSNCAYAISVQAANAG